MSAPLRSALFVLFLGGILACGVGFAWHMLAGFDLINLIRDANKDDSFYYFYLGEQAMADFEAGFDGWLPEGEAVTNHGRHERYKGQQPIGGNFGPGFLTTFHPDKGDRVTGRALSPEFAARADQHLAFLIAGGAGSGVGLRLLADGEEAAVWRGRNTERFEAVVYSLAEVAGKRLQLELFDDETGGWGHIMLDHVMLSGQAPASFEAGFDGWLPEGEAVTNHSRHERYKGQQPIGGNFGPGFLTTFHPDKGDRVTGRALSPEFAARADQHLAFLIAGGAGSGVGLRLLADGEEAAVWRGRNTERFEAVVYSLAEVAGKRLQLELFDDETGGWGHIMLDHVMLSGQAPASFEAGFDGWLPEGEAVTNHSRHERYKGQQPIGGNFGPGFLTTFHPDKGDRVTGRALSPEFAARADQHLAFLIAGGAGSGVGLRLLADGEEAAVWRGKNSERFETVFYSLAEVAGKRLQLELFDDETGGWGHIMLDHVMLSGQAPANFEAGFDGWLPKGEAVTNHGRHERYKGQQPIDGNFGPGFLTTFHPDKGNRVTGRALSPEFAARADQHLAFLIAGGAGSGVGLRLLADGEEAAVWRGKNSERFETVFYSLAEVAGKRLQLELFDDETGGWGHIMLDHVMLSGQAPANFEAGFDGWLPKGEAVTNHGRHERYKGQQPISGNFGPGFLTTFHPDKGNRVTGRALSPEFAARADQHLAFLIAGGAGSGVGLRLLADGEEAAVWRGKNSERFETVFYSLAEVAGKRLQLELFDDETGGWGHIMLDHVMLSGQAPASFEAGFDGWLPEGEAVTNHGRHERYKGQQPISGNFGPGFLTTFHPDKGNRVTGRALSPEFTARADRHLAFLIAGGSGGGVGLRLLADGEETAVWRGKNSERFEAVVYSLAEVAGKRLQLELFDDETGDWGHIMLDHVMLTRHSADGVDNMILRLSN